MDMNLEHWNLRIEGSLGSECEKPKFCSVGDLTHEKQTGKRDQVEERLRLAGRTELREYIEVERTQYRFQKTMAKTLTMKRLKFAKEVRESKLRSGECPT
jgi:hypothetical protein